MNEEQFNIFCGALPHSTYVIQWSGSHVWKIGGKVFSIAGWNKGDLTGITFKISDIAYEFLCERPG